LKVGFFLCNESETDFLFGLTFMPCEKTSDIFLETSGVLPPKSGSIS
jgi:hypothetical protein